MTELKNSRLNIGAVDSLNFFRAKLQVGATLLDVGCGNGDLAKLLMDRGFEVTAIDAREDSIEEARKLGVNAELADFMQYEKKEGFDALLFSRSLHHIHPVDKAVQHALTLLKKDGLLLLEDFGVEWMDEKSAVWFYGLKSVLEANARSPGSEHGQGADQVQEHELEQKHEHEHRHGHEHGHGHGPHGPKTEAGQIPKDPLKNWRDHHIRKHDVAEGGTVLAALHRHFDVREEYRLPYLFRYFVDDVSPQQVEQISVWETELCKINALVPIGVRFVGKKPERI